MKTKKITFGLTFVLLLSILATSCIPGGGNPQPTNLVGVNISLATYFMSYDTINRCGNNIEKTVVIDGDSISFKIQQDCVGYTIGGGNWSTKASIKVPNESYQIVYNPNDVVAASELQLLGNRNGTYFWNVNTTIGNATTPIDGRYDNIPANAYFVFGATKSADLGNPIYLNPFPTNVYRYLLLKKTKASGYVYLWVKVLATPDAPISTKLLTVKIETARYQIDQIIAGQ